MTKDRIEQLALWAREDYERSRNELKKKMVLLPIPFNFYLKNELVAYLVEQVDKIDLHSYSSCDFGLTSVILDFYDSKKDDPKAEEAANAICSEETGLIKWDGKEDKDFATAVHELKMDIAYARNDFTRYLDSEPIEFEGDIIITDPGYIAKDGDWHAWLSDKHMSTLSAFGFSKWIVRDTLYGDWSCTTFNQDDLEGEPYGQFCADAGMVGVFLADEVLKYNPGFRDYLENRKWTTTYIKDFKGKIWVEVFEPERDLDSESFRGAKRGSVLLSAYLCIFGEGVNKQTGEPIRFKTDQTGF